MFEVVIWKLLVEFRRTFTSDKTFLKRKTCIFTPSISLCLSLSHHVSPSHLQVSVTRRSMVNIWDLSSLVFGVGGNILEEKENRQCLSPFSELHWMTSTLALQRSDRLIHVKSPWFCIPEVNSGLIRFSLWALMNLQLLFLFSCLQKLNQMKELWFLV